MFLVTDRQSRRHDKIRSFLKGEPVIAILLAAVDFEWTVRRAIIALGTSPNKHLREVVLENCHGANAYKKAWAQEVKPRLAKGLPDVVGDWATLTTTAYHLRHKLVHGAEGMPPRKQAGVAIECFLAASVAIAEFAAANGEELFGKRLPVRRQARSST